MKLYDFGATFLAIIFFAGVFGSATFEAGQANPTANNILEVVAKPNPDEADD